MRRVLSSSAVAAALLGLALAACNDGPKPVSVFSPQPPPPAAGPAQGQPDAAPGAPAGSPGELPPGHPPIEGVAPGAPGTGMAVPPPPPGAGSGQSGLAWDTPKGWISQTPSSAMRRAQYKVPGAGGDAECVVFYFGPGQGGDPMSNANRWASQFRLASGADASTAMKTRTLTVGSSDVLLVEVKGTYVGGMGTGPDAAKAGYMLLGAIAEGPDANWFFKFTGPEKTVEAQRAAFEGMVRSLRKGAATGA